MQFGITLQTRNPPQWHRPDHEIYQSRIDVGVLAENLGYDYVWTTEHHFKEDGWSPSQLPVLAAIAARTQRIRLGTYVLLLALHNPIRIAEDVATVDILSNGRMELAVGTGGSAEEFEIFGVPFKESLGRMHEGLAIIHKCFEEESFSFKGKYYEFNNVRMTTKPVQKPLPLWIGASSPKSLVRAGAGGYHLAAGREAAHHPVYDEALRSRGYNPSDFRRIPTTYTHIAETREKAWDEAEAHLHYILGEYYGMWSKDTVGSHRANIAPLPPVGELRKGTASGFATNALIGSPEDAIHYLERFFEEVPVTGFNMSMTFAGMDPRDIRKSVELFAKEVMPHFKN